MPLSATSRQAWRAPAASHCVSARRRLGAAATGPVVARPCQRCYMFACGCFDCWQLPLPQTCMATTKRLCTKLAAH